MLLFLFKKNKNVRLSKKAIEKFESILDVTSLCRRLTKFDKVKNVLYSKI